MVIFIDKYIAFLIPFLFIESSDLLANILATLNENNNLIQEICPNSHLWNYLGLSLVIVGYSITTLLFDINIKLLGFNCIIYFPTIIIIIHQLSIKCNEDVTYTLTYQATVLNLIIIIMFFMINISEFINEFIRSYQQSPLRLGNAYQSIV